MAVGFMKKKMQKFNEGKPQLTIPETRVRVRKDGKPYTVSLPRPPHYHDVATEVLKPSGLTRLPTDESEQNKLGAEMLEWVRTDGAECIEQFPLSKGMPPWKFLDMGRANEYFADCVESSLGYLAYKMQIAARHRKEDGNVIMKLLPMYHKLYRDLVIQKANAEGPKTAAVIQVIESPIPSSDMVPKRIEEKGCV